MLLYLWLLLKYRIGLRRSTTRAVFEVEDKILWQTIKTLNDKIKIFDALRDALRIAPPGAKNGLNDEGSDEPIKKIEDHVQKFMDKELKNIEMI
jgi:hypothetical protein